MERICTNRQLVRYLQQEGVLKTPQLIDAFTRIDRADFIGANPVQEAYSDRPLPIGLGQTISQPSTVAFMFELLRLKRGQKLLDIGSGSGWTVALLAQVTGNKGQVWGQEIIPELVDFGKANLAKYHLPQAGIYPAGTDIGLPTRAPFERILVSAAAETLPLTLVDQLVRGGILVIPIQDSVWRVEKTSGGKYKQKRFPGFAFVPLVVRGSAYGEGTY